MLEDTRLDMEDWMEGPDKNPFGVSEKKHDRTFPSWVSPVGWPFVRVNCRHERTCFRFFTLLGRGGGGRGRGGMCSDHKIEGFNPLGHACGVLLPQLLQLGLRPFFVRYTVWATSALLESTGRRGTPNRSDPWT